MRAASDRTLSRRHILTGSLATIAAAPALANVPAASPSAAEIADRVARLLGSGGSAAQRLDALAAEGRLSGVLTVALAGKPIFQRAYGLANRAAGIENTIETRFNLASMNKMFTAIAIARLAERKRLKWDDPVTRHVGELPPGFELITIADLLTHRTGLGSYFGSPLYTTRIRDNGRTVSDYMEIVRSDRPGATPGTHYVYSNSGYVLLGAVIERLTGLDYYEAVEQLVYRPAGMRHTGHSLRDALPAGTARGYTAGCFARPPSACTPVTPYEPPETGLRGTPAGGGYSTAGDLLRFDSALRSGRLVRPDTLALMTRRHVDLPQPGGPIDGYGYGFGLLRIASLDTYGHNGGTPGASCQVDFLPDPAVAIIVLTNLDGAQRSASGVLRRAVLSGTA